MSNRMHERFQHPKYWALYFTMSQVQLLDSIKKKYEKKQFMQQVPSLPSTVSQSSQFNSYDSEDLTFFKFLNMPNAGEETQEHFSIIDKEDFLQTEKRQKDLNEYLHGDKKVHFKSKSKFKYQSKPVSIASSFDSVLTASEKEVFRAKMQTQHWILPHDLHLLIRVLKNIITLMDKHEPGLGAVNSDIRLLFYLDPNPQKGNNTTSSETQFVNKNFKCNTETSCVELSVSNNCIFKGDSNENKLETKCSKSDDMLKTEKIDKNELLQLLDENTIKCIMLRPTKSVSLQSDDTSKITFDQFHLILEYAWKLFIIKVVKQLNTRIRKEALYSALRTVTAYAVSSVQKQNPKFLPTSRNFIIKENLIKNESTLSIKMSLHRKLELYKDIDNKKSVLSINSSKSKTEHKQIRRNEGNSLMKLFLKHFKSRDTTSSAEENTDKSIKTLSFVKQSVSVKRLVSPLPSATSITSTRTTATTLPSQESHLNIENEKTDAVEEETLKPEPQQHTLNCVNIEDVLKTTADTTNPERPRFLLGSTLRQLTDTDFIITPSLEPPPALTELPNNRLPIEEPVQSSQSASDRSNYYLDAASARAVTQKKLEEIEKKSGVFYEILSYVYDKILSRKSSKDETDVVVPIKSRAASKLSFTCVKPTSISQNNLQHIKDEPPLEKEIKTSYGRLLFSKSSIHSKANFDKTIPPTKNEIKNKAKEQINFRPKKQTKKKIKNKPEKTNKRAKKIKPTIIPDKQQDIPQEEEPKEIKINIIKSNSTTSIKTSSSIVTDSQENVMLPSVSIVCGPRHTASSSISSHTSILSSGKSNTSRVIPPTIQLQESIEKLLPKYMFQKNDENLLNEELYLKNLKISVSQNTSLSCLKRRDRQKLFHCSEKKKHCKCMNEQNLKELLRVILKEIEVEKEKKRALRNLKREEGRITSSTSTHSLELRITRSKYTQSSRSDTCDMPMSVRSAASNLHCKLSSSAFTETDLQAIVDMRVKNSRKFVTFSPTCNDSMKECVVYHVPTLDTDANQESPETQVVLEKRIFNNLDQVIKNTVWNDCYEKDVNTKDKLSKLELSEFSLIFNLLTIHKNKLKFEKKCIDLILTETESNFLKNENDDVLSSSDYSENFSLMPIYEQRTKSILKKQEKKETKGKEHGGSLKSKRRHSNPLYDYDMIHKKKSSSDFGNNTDLLRYKCNDNHKYYQQKNFSKNGRVSQISKVQKVSSNSFTSGAAFAKSLMRDDFEHSMGKVSKTLRNNCRLIPTNEIFVDDVTNARGVQNTLRTTAAKSALIQLPIAYYNSSKTKDALKPSSENKNKHVTWNLLHLPH